MHVLVTGFALDEAAAVTLAGRLLKPVDVHRPARGTRGYRHCCRRCDVEWTCWGADGDDHCFIDPTHPGEPGSLAEYCPHGHDAGTGPFAAVCPACRANVGGITMPEWLWATVAKTSVELHDELHAELEDGLGYRVDVSAT